MQQDISKICADSLRTFSKEKYDIKLKAAHAHELVAAFLGYKSKNAMLADTKHPISKLAQAEIIVSMPDSFIDQRRQNLAGFSSELPDSFVLGEAVYASLFSNEWRASHYRPFENFDKLATFLIENNDAYQHTFRSYRDIPMHHIVDVKDEESGVILTATHAYRTSTGEMLGVGEITINLPRVAGRIGYGKPQISIPGIWTGGAKRNLGYLGVQP